MGKTVNAILKNVLEKSKPSVKDLRDIEKNLEIFLNKLRENIKKNKIEAEIFVGGSYAKRTMVKKDDYDVDIFVRFDKQYNDGEISNLLKKCLKGFKEVTTLHGSRDYFRIDISRDIFFEIIPVMKVKNPRNSNNITDLSYSHVVYIKKKVKSQKVLDDIILAKKFCHAQKCYGAESYIKGFSGYALELLVHYYGSFVKFVRTFAKHKEGKVIIDIEKHHKNKQRILLDLNSSKLNSPIILIDPTYKQRNALATLSKETFDSFKKSCKDFLKNPSEELFELKKIDFKSFKDKAEKEGFEAVILQVETEKDKGDVAGSKLLKFYEHVKKEIERYFEVKKSEFEYQNNKTAKYFFAVKSKKEKIIEGPPLKNEKDVKRFKKRHKNTFNKRGRVYTKEKIDFNIEEFLKRWKSKNTERIKEMYITKLKLRP